MIENPVQWWRLFEAKQYRTSEQVGKASIWNGRRAIGLSKCMGELRLHQKSTVRMTHTEIVIAFKIHKQKDHSKQTCWTWIHKGHTHTHKHLLPSFFLYFQWIFQHYYTLKFSPIEPILRQTWADFMFNGVCCTMMQCCKIPQANATTMIV